MIIIKATGESMYPIIKQDDILVINLNTKDIKIGDIIVCKLDNVGIGAHRLIKVVNNKLYLTKGDNRLTFDPLLIDEKLIGKVSMIIKKDCMINLEKKQWNYLSRFFVAISGLVGNMTRSKQILIWLLNDTSNTRRIIQKVTKLFGEYSILLFSQRYAREK